MKYKIVMYIFFALWSINGHAGQRIDTGKVVKIGSIVPEQSFKLLNSHQKETSFDELKGKVLILDFWATSCASCIESWPKLMKLQEKYQDKLQILLVNTTETKEKITSMLKKWEKNFETKLTLPIVFDNKSLREMFPHESVPHLVWINQKSQVKYITNGEYLNTAAIEKIIKNQDMDIPEKGKVYKPVKWTDPLFVNGNGGDGNNIVFSTVISKYTPEIIAIEAYGTSRDKRSSYAVIANGSVVDMIRRLYGTGTNENGARVLYPHARITYNNIDTTYLVPKINGYSNIDAYYTIQATSKKIFSDEQLKNILVEDLSRYFNIKVNKIIKKQKCLVISRSNSPIREYKTGEKVIKITNLRFAVNNVSINEVVEQLTAVITNYLYFPYPVIDETHFGGKLGNIIFEANISDYKILGQQLNKYGISFSIQERDVDMLEISNNI